MTKDEAERKALDEFEMYRIVQDWTYVSDTDRFGERFLADNAHQNEEESL